MSACSGTEPFALRVLGDSMSPEFEDGAIIIIEPGTSVEHGCFVIAEHDEEYLLRQLFKDNEQWVLKPLNENYPALEISGLAAIKGRVIQQGNRRNRRCYI